MWFKGVPRLLKKRKVPVHVEWACPSEGCPGVMRDNGFRYSMEPPGIHHTCTKCGYTAVLEKSYPRIEYEDVND